MFSKQKLKINRKNGPEMLIFKKKTRFNKTWKKETVGSTKFISNGLRVIKLLTNVLSNLLQLHNNLCDYEIKASRFTNRFIYWSLRIEAAILHKKKSTFFIGKIKINVTILTSTFTAFVTS